MKLTASTSVEAANAAPSDEPGPDTRLRTPAGSPARCTISTSVHGEAGTSSAGLKTMVLPNASAGASFHAGIASGKFHGVISPTTPSGSRVTSTSMPGRTDAIVSPPTRSASPAKNLKMAPARAASPTPSASGLPCSRDSSRPSSSFRARISLPARSRMSKRCCGVDCDHDVNARRAAAIASSRSPRVARANCPTTSLRLEGLMSVLRSVESTGRPSITLGNVAGIWDPSSKVQSQQLQFKTRSRKLIAADR